MTILQTLLNFSEKAARIARVIRQDPCLFTLLIEEKGEVEKNARFLHDFKTLADVLIQEMLKSCVTSQFPSLREHIRGEESSSFTNTLGENINVRICESQKDTADLLSKVLDGNANASNILAQAVHDHVEDIHIEPNLKLKVPFIKPDSVGIWIDPIDSTAEYIRGTCGDRDSGKNIFTCGLPCVTVLVGIFDRASGLPIGGVINQPFAESKQPSQWSSKIFWGVHSPESSGVHNCVETNPTEDESTVLVISSTERTQIQEELGKKFRLVHARGAGYKSLMVIQGLANAYFCSKGSTYRWDTCAPHGILRSLGGGIISFKSLIVLGKSKSLENEKELLNYQLRYAEENSSDSKVWQNSDGLVVYRNSTILSEIYELLKNFSELH